jgi:carbonic anhydrase
LGHLLFLVSNEPHPDPEILDYSDGRCGAHLDHLLQRNKEFAAQQSGAGTLMPSLPGAMPNVKAVIIGCADMRVDPAHVLGIKPGEAVVLRNIGGRITPGCWNN